MTETAADPRVIEIDQFYPHPPRRVWQALTTPELMARWLMEPSGFAPVVGSLRGARRGGRRAAGDQLGRRPLRQVVRVGRDVDFAPGGHRHAGCPAAQWFRP
jgi:hypothetical protein